MSYGGRKLRYTDDFQYYDAAGVRVVEECKGYMTTDARIRLALMLAVHGVTVLVTKGPRTKKPPRPRTRR